MADLFLMSYILIINFKFAAFTMSSSPYEDILFVCPE